MRVKTRSLMQISAPNLYVGKEGDKYVLVNWWSGRLLIWDNLKAALDSIARIENILGTSLKAVVPPECE